MTTECIVYGNLNAGGYSRIELPGGKRMLRHRHAWRKHRGPIPAGMYVLHTCDNRACSNIEHLFLGSQLDNMVDMANKGRGTATLSMSQVTEIRALLAEGVTGRSIAAMVGTSEGIVSRVKRGLRYAWV